MSIFDEYIKDLNFMIGDLERNVSEMRSGFADFTEEIAEKFQKTIESLMEQVDDLIKQAEVETRSHPSSERKKMNEQLQAFRARVEAAKKNYDVTVFRMQKVHLTGKGQSGQDRLRMLETNEKIDQQNSIIQQSIRSCYQSEEIGAETLAELQRNREKIESARDKTQEFAGLTAQADKRLKSMSWRQRTWGLFG